jgi:ribosome-binding ATPase YchF (GTP1/OBG family)
LHLAEKRASDFEKKLKASEKARKKAQEDAASVGDLRERLHAAENALSDRETKLAQWETDIIARFETHSTRFSSNITFSFYVLFTYVSIPTLYLY